METIQSSVNPKALKTLY